MNHSGRDNSPASEVELVELLTSVLGDPGGRIRLPIGDDAAVISVKRGKDLIFTTDSYVEGVHFCADWGNYKEIGYRSMAGALSDVAAMSGQPVAALVSLGLPFIPEARLLESLYSGFDRCARQFGCSIAGGETVSTNADLMITIAVIGEVKKDLALTRSGAAPGDIICVTGKLGRNAAALRCLQSSSGNEPVVSRMRNVFFGPRPRISESEYLSRKMDVSSMIDLSDGLSTDLGHIAARSNVGAVLYEEALPVAEEALEVSKLMGEGTLDYALYGGEDYELLFTIRGGMNEAIKKEFSNKFGIALTVVGEVIESGLFIEGPNKVRTALVPGGFDHLKRRSS